MQAKCPGCKAPELRERWGCDAPAREPVFYITCPKCSGTDQECDRCEGSGNAPVYRCPAAFNTQDIARAFKCYSYLEVGILPVAGGWCDQSAAFESFCTIVNAERGAIERDKGEQRRLLAELRARHGTTG